MEKRDPSGKIVYEQVAGEDESDDDEEEEDAGKKVKQLHAHFTHRNHVCKGMSHSNSHMRIHSLIAPSSNLKSHHTTHTHTAWLLPPQRQAPTQTRTSGRQQRRQERLLTCAWWGWLFS